MRSQASLPAPSPACTKSPSTLSPLWQHFPSAIKPPSQPAVRSPSLRQSRSASRARPRCSAPFNPLLAAGPSGADWGPTLPLPCPGQLPLASCQDFLPPAFPSVLSLPHPAPSHPIPPLTRGSPIVRTTDTARGRSVPSTPAPACAGRGAGDTPGGVHPHPPPRTPLARGRALTPGVRGRV